VLTFFIAGLLYLLRFERVDNLGAYSIPFGDRPSHLIWLCKLSTTSKRLGKYRSPLLQLRVFHFCFLQDGDVGIGVFPEREEVLILTAGFCRIAGLNIGTCKAKMSQ
jgi:hypothetical protein